MFRPQHWILVLVLVAGLSSPAAADPLTDLARAYVAGRTSGVTPAAATALPSYARQTGLACSACHYQFLALTPFGRQFKLNGYVMTTRPLIHEGDSANGGKLDLSPTSLLSAMLTAGVTHLNEPLPDTQNDAVAMPQELGLFLAGQVSSKVGLFSQITYAGADGSIGLDNVDVRYANHTNGGMPIVYGVTLNNNPTVQDLWNTTPAWGYPFISSDAAPGAAAAPVIDGAFSQNSLGLGAYTMVNELLYAEVSVYRSAIQGQAAPDAASGAISGVAPYWRLALQKDFGEKYLMLGTFGMYASVYPDVLSGPTNAYTDIGVDAQFETPLGKGNLVARGSYIHEAQTLDAYVESGDATTASNNLSTFKLNATYYPSQKIGLTAGYFSTTGSTDPALYPADPVEGSANGSPKTDGFIGEFDYNPWENTRLGLQYTGYGNFNGGSTNYDGSGRDASGNDTLFLFVWLAF
ncbi:MAG: hypothetical protein R2910_06035 [Gemmatimonadales bacterium]